MIDGNRLVRPRRAVGKRARSLLPLLPALPLLLVGCLDLSTDPDGGDDDDGDEDPQVESRPGILSGEPASPPSAAD